MNLSHTQQGAEHGCAKSARRLSSSLGICAESVILLPDESKGAYRVDGGQWLDASAAKRQSLSVSSSIQIWNRNGFRKAQCRYSARNTQQCSEAGGFEIGDVVMRYMVVVEQGPNSFGAYVPDLPGCIAAGSSKQEVLQLIQEAIEFHLEGIKDQGASVPQPHSYSEFVEVHA